MEFVEISVHLHCRVYEELFSIQAGFELLVLMEGLWHCRRMDASAGRLRVSGPKTLHIIFEKRKYLEGHKDSSTEYEQLDRIVQTV